MKLSDALDDVNPEVDHLRAANSRLLRELDSVKRKQADYVEAVYRAAFDASVAKGAARIPARPARDKRRREPEVCLIHSTDWQVGKVTSTYNTQVAAKRVTDDFFAKIVSFVDIHRAAMPVRRCDLMLGGDMVEGVDIFPGQAHCIDAGLYDQLFTVAECIERKILMLLTLFDEVHVWEEKGNHGRIGRKGEQRGTDNVDLMAYRVAMERFRHERRVHWHPLSVIPGHMANHVEIGNYRALLAHGDEIKSFGGNTPAFGILRKCTKWKSGGYKWAFQDVYMGHFHTPMTLNMPDGSRIFMTGSPESDNTYATEFMAEGGDPSQRIHFIQPERGHVTAEYVTYF